MSGSQISGAQRWVITGGSGFLGTNLLTQMGEDVEVVVISREAPVWPVRRLQIRYIEQDVREVDAYRNELIPGSVVVHMASSSYPGKAEKAIESDIQDNLLGTIRLAQACVQRGVRALVFLSSGGAVYGDQSMMPISESANLRPISAYGAMKISIETYLAVLHHIHGLPVAILRVGNAFGPWHHSSQGAINVFMRKLQKDEPIEIWGDGKQVRDYVYAPDVARAIYLVGQSFTSGFDVFNVGTGQGRELAEVLRACELVADKQILTHFYEARDIDIRANVLDAKKIQTKFGWRPMVPFEQALAETWKWVQDFKF
jgi:UDP-glucose 4-epimerase